jgi:hypothetical protein
MADVVDFPIKSVRDWLIIERELRTQLSNLWVSPAVQDRLTKKLKAFYQELDVSFNFSLKGIQFPGIMTRQQISTVTSEIGVGISALIEQRLQAYTTKLWIERMNREIDVCKELGIW